MRDSQRDTGHSVGAIVLIVLGVIFLLGQLFLGMNVGSFIDAFFGFLEWPFFIVIPGILLLAVALLGGRGAASFAVPGAVITGTGLILTYQNATGNFESWSYVWGLYPVFVGLALMFVGARTGNPRTSEKGRAAVMTGIALTAIFGLFMEMLFSGNADLLFRYAVPLVLVGGGMLMLFRDRRRDTEAPFEKPKNDPFPASSPERKPKNDYGIDPTLERQIRDALDEDDR